MREKIGILGGTFNPIHNGHLLIAELVREQYSLDKILFIPTFIPPHKNYKPQISTDKRITLIQLAIQNNPFFECFDYEIKKGGISYTIDTIKYIYQTRDIIDKVHLIIGADLLKDFHTWKDFGRLIELVQIVALNRDNVNAIEYFSQFQFIKFADSIEFNITSTLIRDRIEKGKSIKYLVPEEVEKFILSKNLYKSFKEYV
jgi:nicotinate-nucleotide adenylyltransferase